MSDDKLKPDEATPPTPGAGREVPEAAKIESQKMQAAADEDQEETLDATLAADVPAPKLVEFKSITYNPDKARDEARARITYWLLSLLTLLVVGSFISVFNLEKNPTFENIKALIEVMLGPVIALVSAATGFYFGANTVGKDSK